MFCTNCGKEIKDGVKFCPNCGTPVSDEPVNDELAATLTVDGGNYAATSDDVEHEGVLKRKKFISSVILAVAVLVVVALADMGYNKYQDYKAEVEYENWIYDTVVKGLNEVDDTVDVPCEPFEKGYVTKGEIEQHDFGKGNHRYRHYEVEVHFKEGDVWYDSFKDGMVKINAYDFLDTDSGIDAYLYYGDLYEEVMKVFLSQNNDGGISEAAAPTDTPEPEPTEEPKATKKSEEKHDAEYYNNLCIPEGTWPSESEMNQTITEIFGLDEDDRDENIETMLDIEKWVCEEVLTHYAESLPEECKDLHSRSFYPRKFIDVKDEKGNVVVENGLCIMDVYVPMDVETCKQGGGPNESNVDNFFKVVVSYSKQEKYFIIKCPGKYDLGQDECDINAKIEKEWKSKHPSN